MKTCPKCKEKIADNATFCQYCGFDTRKPVTYDISAGKTFLTLILLILGIWSFAFLISFIFAYSEGGSTNSISTIASTSQAILRIGVGILAVKDRSYHQDLSSLKIFGIFLLAFIPIGSWFALWYASRQLIRNGMFTGILVGSLLSIASVIGLIYTSLTSLDTPYEIYENEILHSTSTPYKRKGKPTSTSTPTSIPTPYYSPSPDEITFSTEPF